MSIMKKKPYYCENYFTVPDITLLKDNRIVLDEFSFIKVDDFFKEAGSKLAAKYGIFPIRGNNERTYGDSLWGLFDPFQHPRFRLFQADNELLARLLV